MVSRRGFLKFLGAGAAAVVAAPILQPAAPVLARPSAPLFVPAANLDMGVPHRILTATEMPLASVRVPSQSQDIRQAAYRMAGSIPMLLLQDNFIQQYGGKLKAGAEVLVDRSTADRWIQNGVAVAGADAPSDVKLQSMQKVMERQARKNREKYDRYPDYPLSRDRSFVPRVAPLFVERF